MNDSPNTARLLRLSPDDNVAIATGVLAPGQAIELEGIAITLADEIPLGHKVAVTAIASGEKIRKYGCPIGSATCDIHPGRHVHTHNLKSDYFPTIASNVEDVSHGQ